MGVSENSGPPKSSILIGFSVINGCWVPPFKETPICFLPGPIFGAPRRRFVVAKSEDCKLSRNVQLFHVT